MPAFRSMTSQQKLQQKLQLGKMGNMVLQVGAVMYIDTEKKFSSRRIVEMAKARWPQHFASQASKSLIFANQSSLLRV